MNKRLEKLLLLFVFLLAGLSAGAQQVVLHETFDNIEGKGGNDNQWNGSGVGRNPLRVEDFPGWTFNKAYCGNACLKMGTGKEVGTLTTPMLTQLNENATLTIRVGGWNSESENVEIELSLKGGGTISPATLTYTRGAFTTLTATIAGGTASTQLTIAAKQAANNRFFLDDIRIQNSGPVVPPHSLVEVKSLAQLHGVANNTLVRVTFSKENKGRVQAGMDTREAYVSDSTRSVLFSNFLTNDRGWHPTVGGHLAGIVEGVYVVRNGMPTIIPCASSKGSGILCLPYSAMPKPRRVSPTEVADTTLRASLVEMVTKLRKEGSDYIAFKEQGSVRLVDHFNRMSNFQPSAQTDQLYHITAIVGTASDGKTNVLYPTSVNEITGELTLNAQQENQSLLEKWKGSTANVVIQTHIPANEWTTLVLPFGIDNLDETTFADLLVAEWERYDAATQTLHFKTVHSMEAGVPYLVKSTRNIQSIEANEVVIKENVQAKKLDNVTFSPSFAPFHYHTDPNKVLVTHAHPFSAPTETGTLPAFQAYFQWENNSPNALSIAIDGKVNSITSLSAHTEKDDTPDAVTYSISGRRVGNQQPIVPGVYLTRKQRLILK